jgi:hypothetical protein
MKQSIKNSYETPEFEAIKIDVVVLNQGTTTEPEDPINDEIDE